MKRKNHLSFILSLLGMLLGITACAPQPLFFTVTYVSEYGKVPEAIVVEENTKLTSEQLPSLTYEGYTFLGWSIGETLINADSYEVKSDVTLTAKWEKVSEPRKTLKQRINNAKDGETIDLGKEEITINSDESYTVDKTLTIVNGDAKNATFTVTADGVLFKNVANVQRIIAGEELGEGDLAIRNCFEIKYLHVNGGGKNSIHIASTEIEELKVSKKDVRIVLETDEEGESTAKVNKAIIEKDCKLEGSEGLKFETVQIENKSNLTIGEETDIAEFKYKLKDGMFINKAGTSDCNCGVVVDYEVTEDGTAKFWISKAHTGDYTEWHSQMSLNHEFDTAGNYKISFTAKADSSLNTNVDLWCQNKEVTTCSIPLELTSEYKTFTFVVPVHKDLVGISNFNINMSTTAIYLKDLKVEKVEDSSWTLYQSDEILNVIEKDPTSVGHMAILESSDSSVKIYRNARAMKTPAADSQYFVYTPKITTAGDYKFVFTDSSFTDDDVNGSKSVFDTLLIRYKDGTEKEKFTGFTDSKGTYFAKFTVSDEDLKKGIEFVFQSSLNWQWITQYFILNDVTVKSADESVEGTRLKSNIVSADIFCHHSDCDCGGELVYEELEDNEFKITMNKDHSAVSHKAQFAIDEKIQKAGHYLVSFEVKADRNHVTTFEAWSHKTQKTFVAAPIELTSEYKKYSMIIYVSDAAFDEKVQLKMYVPFGIYYIKNLTVENDPTNWSTWVDDSLFVPEKTNLPTLVLMLGDEVEGNVTSVTAIARNCDFGDVDGWKRNFSYQIPSAVPGDYIVSFTKDANIDNIYIKNNSKNSEGDLKKATLEKTSGKYYAKFTIPENHEGDNYEIGFALNCTAGWDFAKYNLSDFSLKNASEIQTPDGTEIK